MEEVKGSKRKIIKLRASLYSVAMEVPFRRLFFVCKPSHMGTVMCSTPGCQRPLTILGKRILCHWKWHLYS